jgi:hypothetical protein
MAVRRNGPHDDRVALEVDAWKTLLERHSNAPSPGEFGQ